MFLRTCLLLALSVSVNANHLRHSPTAIPTSTYGTSPVPSVSSAPTWTPIATESASPSGSKSPRPSKSSQPSVSETRSARVSSSQTSTARLSSEPSRSSLATTSPTFSVSVTTSTSASVTSTPSVTPSITPSPCALWYQKWHPKSQPCDRTGWETKDGANASSLFTMIGMLIAVGIFIAITVVVYSLIQTGHECICERPTNRPYMHIIGLAMAFIPCFFPLIFYIMNGTIEGYDQTPYKIASGVLACVWIYSVFCQTPMCIKIEDCFLCLKHRILRLRQWSIQQNIQRRIQIILRSVPVQHVASLENGSGASSDDPSKSRECSLESGVSGEREISDECIICRDNPDSKKTILPCKHSFHTECIDQWYSSRLSAGKSATCPCCRAVMHTPVGSSK